MKKSIIFAALAAAAVAMPSCSSNDDVINNEGEGIRFSVYAGKTSRAVAVDNNSISKFHVWGVAANNKDGFFMNCDVTKVSGAWTYSPTKFWPQSNLVNFYAVSAGTKTGGYVDITGSVTPSYAEGKGGFTMAYTIPDAANVDVLYAAYYGAHKATGTVPLNFHHALSQLAFQAKCTNADLTVYIKSIKVQNLCNQGSFAGPKAETKSWLETDTGAATETGDSWGKWSGQQGKVEYTAPFYGNPTAALTATAADYSKTADGAYDGLLVLPQSITSWDCVSHGQADALTGSRFLIECRILSGDASLGEKTQIWPAENNEYAYVAIPVPAKTWKQGMRYIYTFDFNEGAGYTPDPDPEDPGDPDKPQPVLSKVKIKVTVDEFQNGGVIEAVGMGTAN